MSSSLLLLGAVLLILFALLFWQIGQRSAQQQKTQAYLQQTLTQLQQNKPTAVETNSTAFLELGPHSWNNLIARAGLTPTRRLYSQLALVIVLVFVATLFLFSLFASLVSLIITPVSLLVYLMLRAEKQKQKMHQQLPDLLDSMTRLLSIGNSLGSAFHGTVPLTTAPLRPALDRVSALMYSGQSFDVALYQVGHQYRLKELNLIAGIVRIATQFGGRSDQVFQRLSRFMRDQEQARQELHALSTEVRLSAWILALLPVGIAATIITLNPTLLINMWQDPSGKIMLLIALILQITGSYWLYKLAKSL